MATAHNVHNRGKGKAIAFIRAHVDHTSDSCLTWPMSRLPNGYGVLGWNGEKFYAHRLMCEMANGKPPTPQHEAAHSCGQGHEGCINPRHLSWKTASGNMLDAREHGTHAGNPYGNRGQLKPEQVLEIRRLRGQKTQAEIAKMFGVKEPTVRDIYRGHTYRSVHS